MGSVFGMQSLKIGICIPFVFCLGLLSAQNIHLPLTERAEDGQYNKLIMGTPVFAFNSDSVANPLDLSAANAENKTEWKKAIRPTFDLKFRNGYAWVFNGSAPLGFSQAHTLIAIQNPGWTFYETLIWTDKNNNLDLTDDGDPDTLTNKHGVVLTFGEGSYPYQVYVQHFPGDKFPLYCSLNDGEINKVKGQRLFFGTGNSLREKRLNVVAGRWKNGNDSFSIAIKDVNCNGKYNDFGIDVAMIADYHGHFDNLQGVQIVDKGKTYLEWNNCAYLLKDINQDGTFIDLYRDSAAKMKNSLNLGQKIPRFKYCTAYKPQKQLNIRKLRQSYVFVYLWRDGANDFLKDSADFHWLGNHQGKEVKVLGLNFGGSGRYVHRYNKRYNTQILQGFSSNAVNRKLMIHEIPIGILLDKKQRIIAMGITPSQAKAILVKMSLL